MWNHVGTWATLIKQWPYIYIYIVKSVPHICLFATIYGCKQPYIWHWFLHIFGTNFCCRLGKHLTHPVQLAEGQNGPIWISYSQCRSIYSTEIHQGHKTIILGPPILAHQQYQCDSCGTGCILIMIWMYTNHDTCACTAQNNEPLLKTEQLTYADNSFKCIFFIWSFSILLPCIEVLFLRVWIMVSWPWFRDPLY